MNLFTEDVVGAGLGSFELPSVTGVEKSSIMEDKVKKKTLRMADAMVKKTGTPAADAPDQSNSFLAQNASWINPLKDVANVFLPTDNEFDKVVYDKETKDFGLLSDDWGSDEVIARGSFSGAYKEDAEEYLLNGADFKTHQNKTADADSPFANTRDVGHDSFETSIDMTENSKFATIGRYADVSNDVLVQTGAIGQDLAEKYKLANPEEEFTLTGERDVYDRDLIKNDKFKNYMLSQGGSVPVKGASKEDIALYESAKANKLGAFANADTARVADAQWRYNQIGGDLIHETGIGGDLLNVAKSAGEGLVGFGYGAADFVAEVAGGDLGAEDERSNKVKELFNDTADNLKGNSYAEMRSALEGKDAVARMQAYGVSGSDVGDLVTSQMTASNIGGTIAFLGGMAVGGPVTTVGRASVAATKYGKVIKAKNVTADTIAKVTEKVDKSIDKLVALKVPGVELARGKTITDKIAILEKLGTEQSFIAKSVDFTAKHFGEGVIATSMINDRLNAYKDNNGGVPADAMKVAEITVGTLIFNRLDYFITKGVVVDASFKKGAVDVISGMSKEGIVSLTKTAPKAMAMLGFDVTKEALTEAVQEGSDVVHRNYRASENVGEDGKELGLLGTLGTDEAISQMGVAAGGGIALGGGMAVGSAGAGVGGKVVSDKLGTIDPTATTAFSSNVANNIFDEDLDVVQTTQFTKESSEMHVGEVVGDYAALAVNASPMPLNAEGEHDVHPDLTNEQLRDATDGVKEFDNEVKYKGDQLLDKVYAIYNVGETSTELRKEVQKLVVARVVGSANAFDAKTRSRLGKDNAPADLSNRENIDRVERALGSIKGLDPEVKEATLNRLRIDQVNVLINEEIKSQRLEAATAGDTNARVTISQEIYKEALAILNATVQGSYEIPVTDHTEIENMKTSLEAMASKNGAMDDANSARSSIFVNGFSYFGRPKKSMDTHMDDMKRVMAQSIETSSKGQATELPAESVGIINELNTFLTSRSNMEYIASVQSVLTLIDKGIPTKPAEVQHALQTLRNIINDTVIMKKYYIDEMLTFGTDVDNKIPAHMQAELQGLDSNIVTSLEELQLLRNKLVEANGGKFVEGVDYLDPSKVPSSVLNHITKGPAIEASWYDVDTQETIIESDEEIVTPIEPEPVVEDVITPEPAVVSDSVFGSIFSSTEETYDVKSDTLAEEVKGFTEEGTKAKAAFKAAMDALVKDSPDLAAGVAGIIKQNEC